MSSGFCGNDPSGFGPLNIDKTDLAPCFQVIMFGIPPFVMAVLLGCARIVQVRGMEQSDINVPALWGHRARMISSLVLVGVPILFMLMIIAIGGDAFWRSDPYVIVSLGLQAVSWAINALTLEFEYRKGVCSSWFLRSFWIASFLSATKYLQTEILRAAADETHALIAESAILYCFQIMMLYYGICGIDIIPSIYDDPLIKGAAYTAPYQSSTSKKLNLQKKNSDGSHDKIWGDWLEYGMNGGEESTDPDDENANAEDIATKDAYVPLSEKDEIEFTEKLFSYVQIPSWAEAESGEKRGFFGRQLDPSKIDKHTEAQYSIHVGTLSDISWTTFRTYTDFEALHERLMEIGTEHEVSLPPMIVMDTLDAQRLHLQKYMQYAIDQDAFSNELARFLHYRENIGRHSSGGTTTTGTGSTTFTRSSGVVSLHSIHGGGDYSNGSDPENIDPSQTSKKPILGGSLQETDMESSFTAVSKTRSQKHFLIGETDTSNTTFNDRQLIGVRITKWTKWPSEDDTGNIIVTFNILIQSKDAEWSVPKKYNQIRDLHLALEEVYGKLLPEMPRRSFVGDQSRDFLNRRKKLLEAYLQSLIMTDAFQCDNLFDFFELSKHSDWRRSTPRPDRPFLEPALTDSLLAKVQNQTSASASSEAGQGEPNDMDDDLKDDDGYEEPPQMRHRKSTVVLSDDSDSSDDDSVFDRSVKTEPIRKPGATTEDEYEFTDSRTPVESSSDVGGTRAPNPMIHRFRGVLQKWTLSVPSDPRSSFIEYWIDVKEYFSVSDYIGWQVKHRYRDFMKLRKRLKKKFGRQHSIPKLPPKGVVATSPHADIDKRAKQLEVFLQQLINTSAFQCDDLYEFLDINNPNRTISFGSHNNPIF